MKTGLALLRNHVAHDAKNPRRQLGLAAEIGQSAVDSQKNFLREVLHLRLVGHASRNQGEDQAFVLINELPERFIVALPAPFDELML